MSHVLHKYKNEKKMQRDHSSFLSTLVETTLICKQYSFQYIKTKANTCVQLSISPTKNQK
jgi:hypothetical protein